MTYPEPDEIQNRLKKRFLDRLASRIGRIRKELIERNWRELKAECRQIKSGGESFGFPELAHSALTAEITLPEDDQSPAVNAPEAKKAVEHLISAVDELLISHSISP